MLPTQFWLFIHMSKLQQLSLVCFRKLECLREFPFCLPSHIDSFNVAFCISSLCFFFCFVFCCNSTCYSCSYELSTHSFVRSFLSSLLPLFMSYFIQSFVRSCIQSFISLCFYFGQKDVSNFRGVFLFSFLFFS